MVTFSNSKMTMFMNCPAKYYLAYVMKIPGRTDYPRLMGTGIHSMVARFHRHGNQNNPLYYKSVDTALKAWTYEWFRLLEENTHLLPERIKGKDYSFLNVGKECLKTYWEQMHKKQPPLHVEKHLSAVWGNVKVMGIFDQIREIPLDMIREWRPDLLDAKGNLLPGYLPYIIVDLKTGLHNYDLKDLDETASLLKIARHQFPLHEDLQATVYTYIFNEVFGQMPLGFVYYYLRHGKFFLTFRTAEDFETLGKTIDHIIVNLNNVSFPKKPGSQCKWCDYFNFCRGDRDLLLNVPVTELEWIKEASLADFVSGVSDPTLQLKLGLKIPKQVRDKEILTVENGLSEDRSILEIPSFERKEV